jgi:3'(2'), 5'-bisphosphate nucleotidase
LPSTDDAAAAEIARLAGERLLAVRDLGLRSSELARAGDLAAQEVISAELAQRFPSDAILSEEASDDRRRLSCERVWVIDPLDGTREFAEPPRTDWAVHVALVRNGAPITGAVALPARGVVFSAETTTAPPHRGDRTIRLAVSRTRPGAHAAGLAEALGAETVPMGSAGAKAMAVVTGDADAYAHSGGQYEWDSAAPVAVAVAAGLHVSRLDGSPLIYNQPDPWLPDLVICRPELAEIIIATCVGVAR